MAEGADVIVGAVLMDNIVYADGSRRDDIPGGAGLYALAGAALFSDEAVLVTGTGRDLPVTFGPWLERNGRQALVYLVGVGRDARADQRPVTDRFGGRRHDTIALQQQAAVGLERLDGRRRQQHDRGDQKRQQQDGQQGCRQPRPQMGSPP